MSELSIPGSRLPAIVQLARLSRDPHGHLGEQKRRYGDLFQLRIPGQRAVAVVCDPEGVKALTTAGYDEISRNADGIRFILGDHSVIFQQDAPHRETRKLMVAPFHGERMRAYGADMLRLSDEVLDRLGDGERRVLHKDMQDITLSIILRCVFGIEDAARMRELGRLIVEYLDGVLTPWFYAATLALSGARVRDALRAGGRLLHERGDGWLRTIARWPIARVADRIAAIDAILFDEIARCRRLPADERAKRQDILSQLVAARYDDGSALGDVELRDHLMTLLIGGHETTATSICWALYCALSRPGTIERMRAEVDTVMGTGGDAGQVKQLTYTGAVINESMRLYPIAWGVPRQLKNPMRIGGHTLPAGTLVSPSVFHTQRDPRVWEAPDEFRPERFLAGKASVYTFFPFGAGVWRCLGAQFAEYEMRVVLARIVQTLDLTLAAEAPIRPLMRGFTIAPSEGLPVRVQRRRLAQVAA
jgi:cytochrome P450